MALLDNERGARKQARCCLTVGPDRLYGKSSTFAAAHYFRFMFLPHPKPLALAGQTAETESHSMWTSQRPQTTPPFFGGAGSGKLRRRQTKCHDANHCGIHNAFSFLSSFRRPRPVTKIKYCSTKVNQAIRLGDLKRVQDSTGVPARLGI